MNWLWSGTRFEPCDGIPPSDRGFRYGLSFFETAGVRSGRPVLLAEHLAILREACAESGWPVPDAGLATIPGFVAGLGLREGTLRIYLTAGDGSPRAPVVAPRLLLMAEPEPPATPCDLRLVLLPPGCCPPARPGRKTGNYWASIEAARMASEADADEVVRLDAGGGVISAAMANLFAVIGDEIVTPPAGLARAGVTRAWALARGSAGGLPFSERPLAASELAAAREIFLTNSRIGVRPAASLDGCPLPGRRIGAALAAAFDAAFPRHG
jgi:branched-chain amino acid aminotransferase